MAATKKLNNTQVKRSETGNTSTTGSKTSLSGVSSATNKNLAKYSGSYQQSAGVKTAANYLASVNKNKPGTFTSQYGKTMNSLLDQINNRDKFTYDINSDMLYQQAKNQYAALGKQAMQDTMGQAAAMTGGYGNSYASTAGNQAYQSYLQQLNDNLPEYYQMAKSAYDDETNNLYNKYSAYSDAYNQDYSRYRDKVSDWQSDRDYAYNAYNSEKNYDYNEWNNLRNYYQNMANAENADYWDRTNYDYQKSRDAVSDSQWAQQMDYQKSRDAVSDNQWAQQMEYQKSRDAVSDNQWAQEYALSKSAKTASASKNTGLSASEINLLKEAGTQKQLASMLDDFVESGKISEEMADKYMDAYALSSTAQSVKKTLADTWDGIKQFLKG